jgi:thioredoxin 2
MSVTIPCPFCATLNRVELDKLAAGPKCGSCHRPLHVDRPVKVGPEAFDAVLSKSEAPILVDFYADWCGPCKMVAPVVDELASARAGEVLVVKVDTDQHMGVTQRFGIRGIPTLIAFKGGKEIGRHVGLARRDQLDTLLAKA